MISIWDFIKFYAALIGVAAGAIFGRMDGFMFALVAFVVIDYITGVLVAIYKKKLSSEVGFKGIIKKVCIFILVAVGNIFDMYVMESGACVRTSIIFFYIANEGISILENVSRLNVPIPSKLKEVLEQLKDDKKG